MDDPMSNPNTVGTIWALLVVLSATVLFVSAIIMRRATPFKERLLTVAKIWLPFVATLVVATWQTAARLGWL